jgi:hypothetical protein
MRLMKILFLTLFSICLIGAIDAPYSCLKQLTAVEIDAIDPPGHNCRLFGIISNGLQDSILITHLVYDPQSLKQQASYGNIDGWGIAYYGDFGIAPSIVRGAIRAFLDFRFDSVVSGFDNAQSRIVLAHIRNCTSGCCCHGCNTIDDPHPFLMHKDGRDWTFIHNGAADKRLLYYLIGPEYLAANPPTGSGVENCDPQDTSNVTDSELLFIYLMKHIEQSGFDTDLGIREALAELITQQGYSALNFILTDSHNLWAFRKGHTMFCRYDTVRNYTAIASIFTSSQQGPWHALEEYEIVRASAGGAPQYFNLRSFLPPHVECPGDTTMLYIDSRGLWLDGFGYSDPDNNISTVTALGGNYHNGRISFEPSDGENLLGLIVTDSVGNVAACTTHVIAIHSFPGQLSGIVTDTLMQPLANAFVSMNSEAIGDSTDSDGNYLILELIPGVTAFRFHCYGFMDTVVTGIIIIENETIQLNIALRPGCSYIPGDANASGEFNGLDVGYSINYFKGIGNAPSDTCACPGHGTIYSAGDANGNCVFNGLDISYSVNFLKGIGPAPHGCAECPPAN